MATADQLSEWSGKYEDEYIRFDRIPESERLHPSRDMSGLLKLASLMENPSMWEIAASAHDEFWPAGPDPKDVTEEDFLYLNRCGVRWDNDIECWAMFA